MIYRRAKFISEEPATMPKADFIKSGKRLGGANEYLKECTLCITHDGWRVSTLE